MAAVYSARFHRVSLAALLFLAAFSCVGGRAWSKEEGRVYPALFGSSERMFADTSLFPKWSDMLRRLVRQDAIHVTPCRREQGLNFCEVDKWKRFVESLRGGDRMRVLDVVNRYMNAYPYVLDIVNYGVGDYWATPQEHVTNGGDCEDYAIAKYITLRKLGFSSADMRVVVLNDLNLKIQHAVLAVYVGNRIYILDNQAARIQPADQIFHYQPIYSVTEGAWWMHFANVAAGPVR